MKKFTPPRFVLASGLESEIEWIYHNQNPRAVIVIRTPEDPPLPKGISHKSDEGEELAVVSWIDAKPDATTEAKILADAMDFLDEFCEQAADSDDEEDEE